VIRRCWNTSAGRVPGPHLPHPPGGQRRVELTYSQVLPQTAGLVHYRYPLNTEKFSSSDIDEVAVTVHLADKAPIRAIYSPSHLVEVMREGDRRATVSYEAQNVRPTATSIYITAFRRTPWR